MVFIEEFSASLEDDFESVMKVVVVGDGGVGKSSMIQRFCKGNFTDSYKKTIGVDFLERHLRIGGEDVRMMVWDTAGQEEFDTITRAYYRGAKAGIVVFSSTDRESFNNLSKWKKKLEAECNDIAIVLVRNKIDLQPEITQSEGDQLARELGVPMLHTSVKTDTNVGEVFQSLASAHLNRNRDQVEVDQVGVEPIIVASLGSAKSEKKKNRGSCSLL